MNRVFAIDLLNYLWPQAEITRNSKLKAEYTKLNQLIHGLHTQELPTGIADRINQLRNNLNNHR